MMIAVAASKKINLWQTEFWATVQLGAGCYGNAFVLACHSLPGIGKKCPVLLAFGKSITNDDIPDRVARPSTPSNQICCVAQMITGATGHIGM